MRLNAKIRPTTALLIAVLLGACGNVVDTQTTTISELETSNPIAVATTAEPTLIDGTATVASITDGDTIRVILPDGSNEPVRLIGIDAPEPGNPFTAEATQLLTSLIGGREVELVSDVSDRDRFGRLLRYVYLGDVFVNLVMVESGFAIAREYPPDTAEAATLATGAGSAEVGFLGVWSSTTSTLTTLTTTSTAAPTTTFGPTTTAEPASDCHPSYEGACLEIGIGDYDCAGGSGNGPNFVRGPVQVVGNDEFGLDRDNDGVGCEQ